MDEKTTRAAEIVKCYATRIRLTRERELMIDMVVEILSTEPDFDEAAFRAACQPPAVVG